MNDHPKYVSEQFERKILDPSDKPVFNNESSIKYNLPSLTYFKYHDIESDITNSLKKKEFDSHENLVSWFTSIYKSEEYLKYLSYFLFVKSTGSQFIIHKNSETEYQLKQCNLFERIIKKDSNEIELNIVPAEIDTLICHCMLYSINPQTGELKYLPGYIGQLLIPIIEKHIKSDNISLSAKELIEGKQEETKNVSKLSVAFWSGIKKAFPKLVDDEPLYGSKYYPLSTNHYAAPFAPKKNLVLDDTYASLSLRQIWPL